MNSKNIKIIRSGIFINFNWYIVKNNSQLEYYIRIPENNKIHENIFIDEMSRELEYQQDLNCGIYNIKGLFLKYHAKKNETIKELNEQMFRLCMLLIRYRKLSTNFFEEFIMYLKGYIRIDKIKIPTNFKHPSKEKLLRKFKIWTSHDSEILIDKNNNLIDDFCNYYIAQIEEENYIKIKRIKY